MSAVSRSTRFLWVFGLVAATACIAPGPQVTFGDLAIRSSEDPALAELMQDVATVEFGNAFVGWTQRRDIVLVNVGRGPLTIQSVEVLQGSVAFSPAVGEFEVNFTPNVDIDGATELSIPVWYRAESVLERAARLRIVADVGGGRSDAVEVLLTAQAVTFDCSWPDDFDFGAVARGATSTRTLRLRNPTAQPAEYIVGPVQGHDISAFIPRGASGTVQVEPDGEREVVVDFTPTEVRTYSAGFSLTMPPPCGSRIVALTGRGVERILSWSQVGPDGAPAPQCDFGYVTPGSKVTRELEFSNEGFAPLTLSQLNFSTNEFDVPGADGGTLRVPGAGVTGNGTAKLRVSFSPSQLGARNAMLSWTTQLASQPTGTLICKGFGGGPDIDVVPVPTLDFGVLHTGSPETRRLTVMNVGTLPQPGDVSGNLHLGAVTVASASPGSDGSEISVALVGYAPTTGLEAKAGANTAYLDVTVSPSTVGQKAWDLSIPSNDSDEPVVVVRVVADVQP